MKGTDDWKRKKQEYYQNVLKPRQQEKARLKREAKEQAKAKTPQARL